MTLSLVACALVSAIIAVWMAYLSTAPSSILSSFAPFTATDVVQGVQKEDRLLGLRFEDRWNPVGPIKTSSSTDRIEKIPVGCETAFSRLFKVQNFLARCLA
jgi:hypothetical protein